MLHKNTVDRYHVTMCALLIFISPIDNKDKPDDMAQRQI